MVWKEVCLPADKGDDLLQGVPAANSLPHNGLVCGMDGQFMQVRGNVGGVAREGNILEWERGGSQEKTSGGLKMRSDPKASSELRLWTHALL